MFPLNRYLFLTSAFYGANYSWCEMETLFSFSNVYWYIMGRELVSEWMEEEGGVRGK